MLGILAISMHDYRRITEIGLIVDALAGLALVVVGFLGFRRLKGIPPESPMAERLTLVIAGALFVVGFALQVVGTHK